MMENRTGGQDRVPSPIDLVRLCRQQQQLDSTTGFGDSQQRLSVISIGGGPPAPHPSLASTPDINADHRIRILTHSTTAAPTLNNQPSPPAVDSSSPGDVFQGGLFDPKSNHFSPFVNDFRPHSSYGGQKMGANGGDGDDDGAANLSLFTDAPTNANAKEHGTGGAGDSASRKKSSDKTPMCLIAEVARYNGEPVEYKLMNEGGPAHQKVFTVSLTIGVGEKKEEFIAQGASIKKAQQTAAQAALEATKFKKRPARFNHKSRPTATTFGYCSMENSSLTPTVMLNALAMKMGSTPEYTYLNNNIHPLFPSIMQQPPSSVFHPNHSRLYRGAMPPPMSPYIAQHPPPSNYHYPHHHPTFNPYVYPPPPFARFAPPPPIMTHYVSLRVGEYEFRGQGPNRQLAKHDAALKALRALNQHVKQDDPPPGELATSGDDECKAEAKTQETAEEDSKPIELEDIATESKSPINIIYEFTLRRHMDASFEVITETGPAHRRHFVVRCIVTGPSSLSLSTEGEGVSKKAAKHDAASKMLETLKQSPPSNLPPLVVSKQQEHEHFMQQKLAKEKKKKPTIIKDLKSDPSYGQEINPVSRLIQVQQAKKLAEPTFDFLGEDGHARCKEFVVKVTIDGKTCEGRGPNKKLAKRAAAEAMLDALGYAKPLPTPGKPVLKHRRSSSPSAESSEMPDKSTSEKSPSPKSSCDGGETASNLSTEKRKVKFQLSDESKNDDESRNGRYGRLRNRGSRRLAPGLFFLPGAFEDCDKLDESNANPDSGDGMAWGETPAKTTSCAEAASGAKEQLDYLAKLLSFQVNFTDFPKSLRNGGEGEYLSLISLTTSPPFVCHGSGATVQQAQNDAALAALRSLAEKGLSMGSQRAKLASSKLLAMESEEESNSNEKEN